MTDTNSMHIAICDAYSSTSRALRVTSETGGTLGYVPYQSVVSITRPADVIAYDANDALSNSTTAPAVLTFANAARVSGLGGYITKARMTMNSAVVTNAVFRLWLFTVAPTPVNDNAAFPLLWANRASRLGYIDFTLATEGTGSDSAEYNATGLKIPYLCAATSLYGLIEVKAAYTPISAGVFQLELSLDRN